MVMGEQFQVSNSANINILFIAYNDGREVFFMFKRRLRLALKMSLLVK